MAFVVTRSRRRIGLVLRTVLQALRSAGLGRGLSSQSSVRPRILYVPGPGDVQGTYTHWQAGRSDPSIPSIAYSAQVYDVAAQLDADLCVITEANHSNPLDEAVRFVGMEAPKGHGIRYHLSEIAHALGIIRRAVAWRADTLLVQRQFVHFWPLAVAKLFRIKLIVSLHNTLWVPEKPRTGLSRVLDRFNALTFRRCARVICVSEAVAMQVRSVAGEGFDRTSVHIPQYDDPVLQLYSRRMPDRPLRQVLFLGRVEVNKGVMLLLEAFRTLASAHPDLQMRIVGDGGAVPDLQRAVAELPTSLRHRVRIAGPANGSDVFSELARADLLVCPTTSEFAEGLAKTPIEAMLAGVPAVLSANVPAAALLGNAARIVASDSSEALIEGIDALIRKPELLSEMSRAAERQRISFFDRSLSFGTQVLEAIAQPSQHSMPSDSDAQSQAHHVPVSVASVR